LSCQSLEYLSTLSELTVTSEHKPLSYHVSCVRAHVPLHWPARPKANLAPRLPENSQHYPNLSRCLEPLPSLARPVLRPSKHYSPQHVVWKAHVLFPHCLPTAEKSHDDVASAFAPFRRPLHSLNFQHSNPIFATDI
jgi:hypothetical protein